MHSERTNFKSPLIQISQTMLNSTQALTPFAVRLAAEKVVGEAAEVFLRGPGLWINVAVESSHESSRQQSLWATDDGDVSPAVLHEWRIREAFFKDLEAVIGAFPRKIAFIEYVAFDALKIPGDSRIKDVTVIPADLIGGIFQKNGDVVRFSVPTR
jgi:hypothetical protein